MTHLRTLFTRAIAACCLPVLAAACAGQSGAPLPAAVQQQREPSHAGAGAPVPFALTIKFTLRASSRPRPHYVSPNTTGAEIAIAPAMGCSGCSKAVDKKVALGPKAPGCTYLASGIVCDIAFALNAGTYVGAMTTVDASNRILSSNRKFPVKIVAGKTNAPTVVLDGVPASVKLFPLGPNAVVFNGRVGLIGPGAEERIGIYATDPDGYAILGAGAPSFTVSTSAPFGASVSGDTILAKGPPQFSRLRSDLNITIHSAACMEAGAQCKQQSTLAYDPIAAVADPSTNYVYVFAAQTGMYPLQGLVQQGLDGPVDAKFDARGDLFVANYHGSTVTEYAWPYDGPPVATITNGVSHPSALSIAPNGLLAVANAGSARITLYSPPYVNENPGEVDIPAIALTFDSHANLWLATASNVQRSVPPYATTNLTLTNGISTPQSIAFDSKNNLYVANHGSGSITTYPAPSYTTVYASPAHPGLHSVSAATVNEVAGCADDGGSVLYAYNLADLQLSMPMRGTQCWVAFDRDGNVWQSDNAGFFREYDSSLVFNGIAGGMTSPESIGTYP